MHSYLKFTQYQWNSKSQNEHQEIIGNWYATEKVFFPVILQSSCLLFLPNLVASSQPEIENVRRDERRG